MTSPFDNLPPVVYQGRKWDAPFTDDAIEGEVTGDCSMCQEPILPEDNAVRLPFMQGHLECHIRSGMGDVAHLEGRCGCRTGDFEREDDGLTYRESAQAALEWVVSHYRGRFHPDIRPKEEAHD